MPTEPIAFNSPESGLEELTGSRQSVVNLMFAADGGVRMRPGIKAWSDFPSTIPNASPVVAMTTWKSKLVYATEDRKLFAWTRSGNVDDLSDSTVATKIEGAETPRFTTTADLVVAVGGGTPQKWNGSGLSARLTGSPPPACIDIVALTQRLVVTESGEGGFFSWSGLGSSGHEDWDINEDFAEAEARPDKVIAVRDTARELYVFGTETTQVYAPDPNEVFAPVSSVDYGCKSRHSIIRYDDRFAWLDNLPRFILSDGRGEPDEIGTPHVSRLLGQISTPSDCWGARMRLEDHDLLVWVFPTDGRVFVFDVGIYRTSGAKLWAEWRGWSSGRWAAWSPRCYLHWPDKNLHLVGLADGSIAQLDLSTYTDSGNPIEWLARSGFSDRGSPSPKSVQRIQAQMRRGEATGDPFFWLRWRNDTGSFVQPVKMSLGSATDKSGIVDKWVVGRPYTHRQWEIYGSSNAAISLARVLETFDVLEEA